jgi:hypothetical protein
MINVLKVQTRNLTDSIIRNLEKHEIKYRVTNRGLLRKKIMNVRALLKQKIGDLLPLAFLQVFEQE